MKTSDARKDIAAIYETVIGRGLKFEEKMRWRILEIGQAMSLWKQDFAPKELGDELPKWVWLDLMRQYWHKPAWATQE